ncbi:MAG: hypothetical protein UY07_C0037G0005 [Parcubacteria group bacterium GW2011_GWA1_47_8]|nr:MAG: hypothetical protein UY07_C0037G0005 [Parcubacteria group bacterium GW2011_GWA1_47_8]KKW07955.1 MAG: hypothetical protein UY42_C0002G0004 [Parcubacteria group bacterium GW2011_GWA2_49_16]
MKHIVVLSFVLFPALAFAGTVESLAEFEDNSGLLASLSVWSAIIVAFITIAMVWIGGSRMHGGIFGSVLNYFSAGMTALFLGFITGVPWVQSLASAFYLDLINSSLYIAGYILMGIAANKLLGAIKGE